MLGKSSRMVTSTPAIAMSGIPTEYYGRPLDRNYYLYSKYWWLRSPNTTDSGLAYFVYSDGDVGFNGHNVYNSYGRVCSTDYSKLFQNIGG